MSNPNKGCSIIIMVITTIFFFIIGINYMHQHSFQEEQCRIDNATWPISVYDSSNLIECRCGRSCKADTGTCIRVYGNMVDRTNPQLILSNTNIKTDNHGCSFAETKCRDGESIENRQVAVEKAKHRAKEYVNMINSNRTITCYRKKGQDTLYLENDDHTTLFIVAASIFGLSCLCMLCCVVSVKKDSPPDSF